jgi:hypothetical protein
MAAHNRTEALLAMILLQNMKGASLRDKAVTLNVAGFSNVEVADLLETSPAHIAQALYESRRDGKKTKKKK